MNKEHEYFPWSLYVDESKDSQKAMAHLLEQEVPFTAIPTPRLPNGQPEEECPCLITGVGHFVGFSRIKYVNKLFYNTVREYQDSKG